MEATSMHELVAASLLCLCAAAREIISPLGDLHLLTTCQPIMEFLSSSASNAPLSCTLKPPRMPPPRRPPNKCNLKANAETMQKKAHATEQGRKVALSSFAVALSERIGPTPPIPFGMPAMEPCLHLDPKRLEQNFREVEQRVKSAQDLDDLRRQLGSLIPLSATVTEHGCHLNCYRAFHPDAVTATEHHLPCIPMLHL